MGLVHAGVAIIEDAEVAQHEVREVAQDVCPACENNGICVVSAEPYGGLIVISCARCGRSGTFPSQLFMALSTVGAALAFAVLLSLLLG